MGEKTMDLAVQGGAVLVSSTVMAAGFPDYTVMLLIAGFFGGVSRWMIERSRLWPDGVINVIAGATIPVFLWPVGAQLTGVAVDEASLDPTAGILLGGYVTGLLGLAIPALILDVFRARKRRILGDEIK